MTNPLDAFKQHIVKPSQLNKPNLILLYGNPGSGKTHLAASISEVPGIKKVLIIDTENSTQGTVADFDDAKIDIIPVSTHGGFEQVFSAVIEAADNGELEYDAVIIDTLDVAQDRAIEFFEENAPITKSGEKDGFAVWGGVKQWTTSVGRRLQEASFIGVLVLHSNREKMENGPFTDLVALSGSAKNTLPGIPDIVGFTERADGVTTVHVGSALRRSTKNRFQLPDSIENPSMAGIFKAITNRNNSNTKPAAAKAAPKGKGQ